MLALHSADAHADAARFKADHIGAYAPFDFGRDAVLPGGGTARVEFSLAFATDPAMPGIAFFTCQQRHPPELFWKPEYQRHPNGALRVIEVVMSAPEPAEHRSFPRTHHGKHSRACARAADGRRARRPDHRARPGRDGAPAAGLAGAPSPRFCAARLAVADLDATKRALKDNGVGFEVSGAVLLVPPAASHGLALEFVEQETI